MKKLLLTNSLRVPMESCIVVTAAGSSVSNVVADARERPIVAKSIQFHPSIKYLAGFLMCFQYPQNCQNSKPRNTMLYRVKDYYQETEDQMDAGL